MAADDEAYDSLGRVLAQGGLRSARAGLEKHAPGPLFTAWLATRFPGLRATEVDQLSHLATQYRTAGQLLKQVQPGATLDDSAIPIVPQLFGADPQGRRYEVQALAKLINPATGEVRYVSVSTQDGALPTADEILQSVETIVASIVSTYNLMGVIGWTESFVTIEVDYKGVVRKW